MMRLLAVAAISLVTTGGLASAGAPDRTPPTTPGNFRVTAVTSYSASLAWAASTDNSGTVRYIVSASSGGTVTLPSGTTSFVWKSGLLAGYRYTFTIRAVDGAGNSSKPTSTTATLPADRAAPTVPALRVDNVGPTHVALSWTQSFDDGPYVTYTVVIDGTSTHVGAVTGHTATGLAPGQTYSASLRAADMWGNAATSGSVAFTTPLPDAGDTTPPTAPTNLNDRGMSFPDGETWLFWDASLDGVTPQSLIAYRVIVNGVLDHTMVGRTETVIYLPTGGRSIVEVVGVDEAGNSSAAATFAVSVP